MEPAKKRDDSYVSEWMEGKCRVFPAPLGIQIKNDQHNFVEPDITLICDNDKLDEGNCHGMPDFIVEIVSPSNWNNASENDVQENNVADNDMPENVGIDSDWGKNPVICKMCLRIFLIHILTYIF